MRKLFLLLVFGIFFVSLASAEIQGSLGTFQQNKSLNLIQVCNCSFSNITNVLYPNGSVALSNQTMSRDGTYFNYTLNNSYVSTLGIYKVNGLGDDNGANAPWSYNFIITSTGDTFSTAGAIVLWLAVSLFIIFGLFLFNGFTKKENKLPIRFTYLLGSFLSFIAAINFISIFIGSASTNQPVVSFFDSFTSIMFIVFWFAFGLVAIMWGLTFFQTLMFKHNKKQMEKYMG